jgi:hypothetical protein
LNFEVGRYVLVSYSFMHISFIAPNNTFNFKANRTDENEKEYNFEKCVH